MPSSDFGGLTFIEGHHHTRKLPITEEGLDVILGKAIVLEHSVELLETLNMMLECDLLLPTTCSVQNVPKKSKSGIMTGQNIRAPPKTGFL